MVMSVPLGLAGFFRELGTGTLGVLLSLDPLDGLIGLGVLNLLLDEPVDGSLLIPAQNGLL